jgi:hypothetical protein
VTADQDHDELVGRITQLLTREGMTVDVMALPPMAGSSDVLRTIASYRSLPLEPMADRVLALDLHACVLRHPAKVAWLPGTNARSAVTESGFLANLLYAGLREATIVLAPKAIAKKLRSSGVEQATDFDPLSSKPNGADAIEAEERWTALLQVLRA